MTHPPESKMNEKETVAQVKQVSNIWDELKTEMHRKFPPLPLKLRLISWALPESQHSLTVETEFGEATQSAVLVTYKGKEYVKRFGWLK